MKNFVLFLVDNNTWNNSHIALVGKAMSSNESAAFEIMTELDVDYVLGKGDLTLFLRHEDSFLWRYFNFYSILWGLAPVII